MSSELATLENRITLASLPNVNEVQSMALMAKYAAASNFLTSTAPRNDVGQREADAFFVIAYGREMGIPPMTALKNIFVIEGKPTASSAMIMAIIRRYGFELDIPDPNTVTDSATVRIKRPGGQWKSYTFTMAMARDMKLDTKSNWIKMRPVMLVHRAADMACRFEGGDVLNGLYPIEELAPDSQVNEEGELIGELHISAPKSAQLPAPQQPTPSAHWSDDHVNRTTLVSRARQAGYIETKDGWDELLKFAGVTPEQIPHISTRGDLGEIIKAVGDKLTAQSKQNQAPQQPAWWAMAVETIWNDDTLDHFKDRKHVENALNKMLTAGELTATMDIEQVMQAVLIKYDSEKREPIGATRSTIDDEMLF